MILTLSRELIKALEHMAYGSRGSMIDSIWVDSLQQVRDEGVSEYISILGKHSRYSFTTRTVLPSVAQEETPDPFDHTPNACKGYIVSCVLIFCGPSETRSDDHLLTNPMN